MILSRNWLNEFVDLSDISDKEFNDEMTLSGSKVETIERLDASCKNVVVGQILEMVRHENSDHMWVCQIDVGQQAPIQIVTGAQNQKVGDLVPVALHDSLLPGGVKIEKGVLRGVVSNGMCCSIKELGLTLHDVPYAIEDGLWIMQEENIHPGDDVAQVIGYQDSVVEFEITPNRPDCLSVIGLAREASATFKRPLKLHDPVVKGGGGSIVEQLDVDVRAGELCPRYTARMVKNVKIAPSPKWMRARLRNSGIRPINNIVDITNYVMLEYGQPMHAFDYRYVKGGKIIVRRANEGEELTTLDGNTRKLNTNHLVIADDTRAVGLAGIMGGMNSEIVDDTVDVVFESANFDGTCIRKGALALGMRTEASAKYEKGLDPMNTLPAVNRACELVELLGAGEVLDGIIDTLNYVPHATIVKLEPEKINALLGTDLSAGVMRTLLLPLGFEFDGDNIIVPSWRGDVEHYSDIAEEVARFYGYNKIPNTLMRGETTRGGFSEVQLYERSVGELCRTMGYDEIITYSFISPSYYDKIRMDQNSPLRKSLKILNPLGEDTSIMRTSILPSMMEILARNYNYRNKAVRLYELGRIYLPRAEDGLAEEPKMLSLGAYGDGVDFFTLKGQIEALLRELRLANVRSDACTDNPSYHPGRCAKVFAGYRMIGVFGQIHPLVAENYGMDCEIYAAELSFDMLYGARSIGTPVYQPLPKFPAVMRDIAVVCDESVTVGALEDCIRRGAKGLLKDVVLFDIYRGDNLGKGRKSVAFNLTLRADDRSLTGEEADEDVKNILALLESELGAKLR